MQRQVFESSQGSREGCGSVPHAYEGDGENVDFIREEEVKVCIIPALGYPVIRGKDTSLGYWKETSRVYLHVPTLMASAYSGPIKMCNVSL